MASDAKVGRPYRAGHAVRGAIHARKRFLFESVATGLLVDYPLTLIDEFFYPQTDRGMPLVKQIAGMIEHSIDTGIHR
jgi:hypothetical protein